MVHAQDRFVRIYDSKTVQTELHTWLLLSVELEDDCTIVEKLIMHIDADSSYISSNKDSYLEDVITGEKYYIKDSEIGFESDKEILNVVGGRVFKEIYPPLPDYVNHINVSSGNKYFVEALDLNLTISPASPPIGRISFMGIPLGAEHRIFLQALKKQGFKIFCEEDGEDILTSEEIVYTYFEGSIDDYPITIKMTTNVKHDVVAEVDILYHNHVDYYELNEHLQDIVDEIKATYDYREFAERKIPYQNATSILQMKSGKDKVFNNVCIKQFDGSYRIFDSSNAKKYENYGIIGIDVHNDMLNNDLIIAVSYVDTDVSGYLRRRSGKFKW